LRRAASSCFLHDRAAPARSCRTVLTFLLFVAASCGRGSSSRPGVPPPRFCGPAPSLSTPAGRGSPATTAASRTPAGS
jgi:hypothetical protein